ncbi:MAG: sigma-70 family RNA polymerase sigma factor [Acidobacteriota bacterium]
MGATANGDITGLLVAWNGGDEEALVQLMPLVYRRLKSIAGHLMRRERLDHTLETSALVNEAFLRLADLHRIDWKHRAHFYAMGARIMRRVLVDHAKHHGRVKRGGRAQRVETAELQVLPGGRAPDVIAVDEAMSELEKHDVELARLVELRFFGGLGRTEIAAVMDMSPSTIKRRWTAARAWLLCYLSAETG